MLFHVPAIKRLLKRKKAFLVVTHMCQYQVPWKKPTTFLIWGAPLGSIQLHRCQGSRCSASGKKHLQLTGANRAGFMTRRAQEYPLQLAEHLIDQFVAILDIRKEAETQSQLVV